MIPALWGFTILSALVAQTSAQTNGAMVGTVRADGDGKALGFARVAILGTKLTAVTGSDGAFIIREIAPGLRVVQVGLSGYGTILTSVTIASGDTTELRVTLAAAAFALAPVKVTGEAPARLPAMRGFEERRAHGQGHYLAREEIMRMQPRRFTDILRRVPGVMLQPLSGPYDGGEAVRMSRTIGVTGARACPVLYYVNGSPFPVTGDVPIDQFVDPNEVAAIEVYSGMSQIPPEFNSSSHNARCGVIVIWTISSLDTLKSEHHP